MNGFHNKSLYTKNDYVRAYIDGFNQNLFIYFFFLPLATMVHNYYVNIKFLSTLYSTAQFNFF